MNANTSLVGSIRLGNLVIDGDRYEVWIGDKRIDISYLEFRLLSYLASNSNRVVSSSAIAQAVWGTDGIGFSNNKLTVHICRVRKLIRGSKPWTIRTVRKRGYALVQTDG